MKEKELKLGRKKVSFMNMNIRIAREVKERE